MITISLCLIVRNEQDTLERCLASVRDIVDEIVLVDTGSTDRTKEIAYRWTSKVIDYEWNDHFAEARNFAFSQAAKDYILWLDADDVLMPEDRKAFLQLKQTLDPSIDAVSMLYHCDFDNHGNPAMTVRRFRLVKRVKNFQWQGAVHEDLEVSGTCYDTDITITHRKPRGSTDPDRNIKIYERLLSKGLPFARRDLLHYAMELHQHRMYEKATKYYLKFLDRNRASAEEKIFVSTRLADCCYYLGDREKEREYIFQSFEYDLPRPEFCCRLGYYFLEKQRYAQAAFWYKLAVDVPVTENSWTVINHPSCTWLPHMQLGQCYYRLGDYEKSYHHNQTAHSYLPDDPGIINNIKLLEEIMNRNIK